MSKFDRCILISIAIGIWAFVLTNIFEPSTLIAHSDGHTPRYDEIVDFEKGVSLYESHHDYAEYSHSHDEG
jgi:hypothetical protein|tara:strand:+ start:248 stop:460 length:213 start_codon:yes stop_codon:yes gene_type:complete